MVAGMTDSGNVAARQGTAEHQVAEECLESNLDPATYIGRTLYFYPKHESWECTELYLHEVTIDAEAVERVNLYVSFVRGIVQLTGGTLLIEQRLPIEFITGEKDAKGTADAIIVAGNTLYCIDYKGGSGKVKIFDEEPNSQLSIYTAAAVREYGWIGEFQEVVMVIVQPRLNAIEEHRMTVADLDAFVEVIRQDAERTRTNPTFDPSYETCQYCKAKAICKAREQVVLETVLEGFTGTTESLVKATPQPIDPERLEAQFRHLRHIRAWCDDIEETCLDLLSKGVPVGNLYLGEGKEGNRKWANEQVVIDLIGDDAYERVIKSPSKLSKHPKFNELQANITRNPGKKIVCL